MQHVPAVNMAEEVLEAVEKLQLRLNENQEPRKLLKTLKRLAELPITVEILVETGVGKTVNSLRKHDVAGDAAKNLVAKWKKLVPEKSTDRPSVNEGRSHSRINEPGGHKRVRERSPEDRSPAERSPEDRSPAERSPEERSPEERSPQVRSPEVRSPAEPPLIEEDQEFEYRHGYSPSPPQHYSSPYANARESDEYESPQEEEPKPSPPRNEVRRSKPHRESVREQSSQDVREQERRRNRDCNERKGHKADREQQGGTSHKSKHVRHLTSHEGRREKKGSSDGKSRERREVPVQVNEDEEQFEVPTMSFESFLTYDAPAPSKKKKKQPSRPAQPSPPAPSVSSKSSKANGTSSKRSEPSSSSLTMATIPEKRKKVVDVVPTLPDIPLPAIQPNYRPLPSMDLTPLSPPRRKVPVSYDEEDAGYTGRRLNSKMVVYSGSKTAYLPKMMSLYDQCIRVLQNNIDSIDEVGGVPYEILEPVLERCTPEQLYRIEQCNQYFTEDSDDLWNKHCKRDFKHDAPQEYESWREMYLRLHEEREERLRKLTMNISSAHANKPKGRQLKMAFVNSVAKPPRDVRRRQERFGIKNDSTSLSTASTSTTKIRPASSYSFQSKSTDSGQSSQSSPPETSSRSSAPNNVGGHCARDKPQVKKIAPMMAKTIKAFKNRFSRR